MTGRLTPMRKRWKKGSKIMEAEPDDPIFSRKFVIGGAVRRASPPVSPKPKDARGRGLPHQYPWIDCVDDPRLSKSSEHDEDA
jgi:hypothetical protein